MQRFVAKHLYLIAVGGGAASFAAARHLGWPVELAVVGWSVLVLIAAALLERVMPFDQRWREADGDGRLDATSALVLIGAVDPLVKASLPVLALWTLRGLGTTAAPWFAAEVPFAFQVLLALLWIEFAKYWSHRLHHVSRPLWWLHALHHGSRRLYWLNNFRFHPLNHAINMLVSLLPLWLLGAPVDVMLAATAVTLPVVMLQHVNLDLDAGWLNRVFSTNELHRLHHSRLPAQANTNFGSALVVWDQIFGTYQPAPAQRIPVSVGLFGNGSGYPVARSYVSQLASMFSPNCCKA